MIVVLSTGWITYTVIPLYAAMKAIDPKLFQAAADLGAGWWTMLRRILLPLGRTRDLRGGAAGLHPAVHRLRHPDTWSAGPAATCSGQAVNDLILEQGDLAQRRGAEQSAAARLRRGRRHRLPSRPHQQIGVVTFMSLLPPEPAAVPGPRSAELLGRPEQGLLSRHSSMTGIPLWHGRKSGWTVTDVDGNVFVDLVSSSASVPVGAGRDRARRARRRGAAELRQRGQPRGVPRVDAAAGAAGCSISRRMGLPAWTSRSTAPSPWRPRCG